MSEWRKHAGTGRPAELAAAQIVEWGVLFTDDPEVDRADVIFDGKDESDLTITYRPALDPDGLLYVSAEGLENETQYVATDGDGEVSQFNAKPHFECFMELDVWTCSEEQDAWPDCPEAPDTHAIPGPPENSLARVWRSQ